MNHRHHLICVVAAVGLAVWFLVAGNGGAALAGVSLALLLCPLVMGVVMWLLMRQPQSAPHQGQSGPHDEHASAGPR
ncbi:MAG: hypothetical protein HZB15_06890 [Actinobacteria bacterium]|nr:hypothetical protein [Actinomycetota bacterium]